MRRCAIILSCAGFGCAVTDPGPSGFVTDSTTTDGSDESTTGDDTPTPGESGTEGEESDSGDESGWDTGVPDLFVPDLCGNGVIDDGEECDDGNDADADGCNTDCIPSGKLLWLDVYDGMAGKDDAGLAVTVHPDQGPILAGYETGVDERRDGLLRRLSASGQPTWTQTWGELPRGGLRGCLRRRGPSLCGGYSARGGRPGRPAPPRR